MASGAGRCVFTAQDAHRIRSVLSVLLAGVESKGNVTHAGPEGFHQFKQFMRGGCDRLILDLRGVEVPSQGMSSAVRNVRAVRLGGVWVVTGEVTDPEVFRQIAEPPHPHVPLKRVTSNLRTLANALFSLPHRRASPSDA
jgi:hypothetical protein